MATIRLAAIYVGSPEVDYLEASIGSILSGVDEVHIGVSSDKECDQSAISNVTRLSSRIFLTEGSWPDNPSCVHALMSKIAKKGLTHALLMGPEDVFQKRDFLRLLDFLQQHRAAGRVNDQQVAIDKLL